MSTKLLLPIKVEPCDDVDKMSMPDHTLIQDQLSFGCDDCDGRFENKEELDLHPCVNSYQEVPIAGMKKEILEELESETPAPVKTRELVVFCDICGRGFPSMSGLNVHLRIHSGERPYSCDVCQKKFISKEGLRSHLLVHTQERRFECDFCNKKFLRKQEMQQHRLIHTGERPYACEICLKTFPRQQRLKKHLQTHTGERPHACDLCDKKFAYRGSLKYHLRRHAGIKPYRCDLCPMSFTSNIHLKKHKRTHTGVKPYCCHVCQKPYANRDSFQKHLLSHSEDKSDSLTVEKGKVVSGEEDPSSCDVGVEKCSQTQDSSVTGCNGDSFECDKCGKWFALEEELTHHHCAQTTRLNVITCNFCKEEFADQSELDKHQLHHKREKPFACFICRLRFYRSANLKLHLSVVHAEAKTCKICYKCFLSDIQLAKHFASHSRQSAVNRSLDEPESQSEIQNTATEPGNDSRDCNGNETEVENGFSRLKLLRHHVLHDLGKKPYYCELCSKSFTDRCYLLRHKRVHTRDKPDACPVCRAQYSTQDFFLKHVHNQKDNQKDLVQGETTKVEASEINS